MFECKIVYISDCKGKYYVIWERSINIFYGSGEIFENVH